MKKTIMFVLPLLALMLAVGCKKQEAVVAPVAADQVSGTAVEAAVPVAAKTEASKSGK